MLKLVTTFSVKNILKFSIFLSLFFISFSASAWFFDDLFSWSWPRNPYWNNWYDLASWTNEVKNTVIGIETNRKFSEYVQDIVIYLLSFVSIIAVIYMIYWGFIMMISAWDEEKLKKTKNIIIYVIVWMTIMWLAYSIVLWLFDVFGNA